MEQNQEWRWVPGYEGHYQVNADGQVRRWLRRHKRFGPPLRGFVNYGYRLVNLSRNAQASQQRVHRLVMAAFVGPCPDGMNVCHNNGNRLDNRLANLRYDTPRANTLDQARHGTMRVGERHHRAKLTAQEVRSIRREYADGVTQESLAQEYGVCQAHISSIVLRRSWGHVE